MAMTMDFLATINFIKQFEGTKLVAYQDQRGIWTIGYGHTSPEVIEGLVWTQAQADAALGSDIHMAYNAACKAISVGLSPQQWAAVISFIFNVGQGNFAGSTLHKLINANDIIGAAKAFLAWDHIDGVENKGLLRRRLNEAALFMEGT